LVHEPFFAPELAVRQATSNLTAERPSLWPSGIGLVPRRAAEVLNWGIA
jgi:hypothetical protein